ncbi:hypothetical protein BRDCF_p948 [Bacteroidales bacterium CF]|nr:hypothetical protein BRDCF_p948 [Bacteroidales bacterium CF]
MSIACQIGTSLITVYNFQTIPVYFLLTNIIAIPLSGIILYIALLHAFTIGIGFHEDIVMKILLILTKFLGWVMNRVESLPYSTIKCSLSNTEAGILLFFLIIFFFYKPQSLHKKDI